jgi:hypothetical protein
MDKKHIGSGYFGEWTEDEFGQPVYWYKCNQVKDYRAVTPVNPIWRAPAEHTHQVGNDRLVAVVSNDGTIRVRQDEGSPKYLNDFYPPKHQYAGGFGYLTDGRNTLSTYYSGEEESFDRFFGTGYVKKIVRAKGYRVAQTVFAPFGDDPLLISQVEVTNEGISEAMLRWVEYWGCRIYQFSFRAMLASVLSGGFENTSFIRRRMADSFHNHIEILDGGCGLICHQSFQGWGEEDVRAWDTMQELISSSASGLLGGTTIPPLPEISFDDLSPPPTFLVSLDEPADGWESDAACFFGEGGAKSPSGMQNLFSSDLLSPEGGAMLLERRFNLEPGASKKLYFAYGYLPGNLLLEQALSRYRTGLSGLLEQTSAGWQKERLLFSVPAEPWVERECKWHNYYLGSNLTYDSYFQEHILSQGHVYQYIMGFQGASRDPLQHALPFIYSRPWIAREIIRYTLKEVQPDGEIPYGIVGHGMIMPISFKPSDTALWLLWLVAEYILATRDHEFLHEMVSTYPAGGVKPEEESVDEILSRCYAHLVCKIGCGRHGLLRLSNGDWNDSVVIGHAEPEQHPLIREQAETVLNAAMASYVFDIYARMLEYTGEPEKAASVSEMAFGQREAVRARFNGSWFQRAWLGPRIGWVGDEELWLEPQPWAIIGGCAGSEEAEIISGNIEHLLRQPSRIGAMLFSKGLARMEKEGGVKAGSLTNGGVWPSINGTLIWALSLLDGEAAWDEWQKNSLCRHAEEYPEIWYGIWSGPDCYNSALSEYPGQTQFDETYLPGKENMVTGFKFKGMNWVDFPVMNMHSHAWPLYSTIKLAGVEFSSAGIDFTPRLPMDEYRLSSPLLGFARTSKGYSGWYAPLRTGKWKITIKLLDADLSKIKIVEVNGRAEEIIFQDGAVVFYGTGGQSEPLRWRLIKK